MPIKIGLYVNTQVWRWTVPDNAKGSDLFRVICTVGARLSEALALYFPSHFYPGRNRHQ